MNTYNTICPWCDARCVYEAIDIKETHCWNCKKTFSPRFKPGCNGLKKIDSKCCFNCKEFYIEARSDYDHDVELEYDCMLVGGPSWDSDLKMEERYDINLKGGPEEVVCNFWESKQKEKTK